MNENELIEQAAEVDLTDRTEVLAQWVAVLDKLTEKSRTTAGV